MHRFLIGYSFLIEASVLPDRVVIPTDWRALPIGNGVVGVRAAQVLEAVYACWL